MQDKNDKDDKGKDEEKRKEKRKDESTSKDIQRDDNDAKDAEKDKVKEKGIEIEKDTVKEKGKGTDIERDKAREKEKGISIEKDKDKKREDVGKDKKDKTLLLTDVASEKGTSSRAKAKGLQRVREHTYHKGHNTAHLPLLTPPELKDPRYRDWYRRASDIAQVQDYADEEDEIDSGLKGDESNLEMRTQWPNQIEFLMSCIATSVGLGNVWRFAFVAYENGGGAFLIPYLVVLILVGKPMYFLECLIGQFSSRNSVRIWSLSPGMQGTGYAQCICTFYVLSYYVAIISLCLYYLVISFTSPLPWAYCRPTWIDCLASDSKLQNQTVSKDGASSAEFYFIQVVLQQSKGLEGGLGTPIWYLTLSLFFCWLVIFVIVVQGVKSSGKAAYFLAIFPYVIMIILLITTCTLPGASKGILFFITPDWKKITELGVWYAAVTQVFFSLSVGIGPIIMFSSYNDFNSRVYRDSTIVTSLDTLTSLLSGFTIFGILGNLAHELNTEVDDVVGSGGTGLAFISYPDALSKTVHPHTFAILFFLMMTVLGFGSAVAFLSTINTVLLDAFPDVRTLYISAVSCVIGFCSGLVYCTPEGQYILTLVDHFGGTFLALFGCIAEVIGIAWVYGLENFCLDVEYMINMKPSMYWRCCWGFITPIVMLVVFFYALINFDGLVYGGDYRYPDLGYICGYALLFIGMSLVPLFIIKSLCKRWTGKLSETSKVVFKPKDTWGPRSATERKNWAEFKKKALMHQVSFKASKLEHYCHSLTGGYRKNV